MKSRSNIAAAAWIAGFGLSWALIEAIGSRTAVPPLQVVWTRYGVQLLFLLLVLGPRKDVRLVRTTRWRMHILRSLLMLGMPLCFLAALGRLGLSDTIFLFWLTSAVTLACMAAVNGFRLTARTVVAAGIGLGGVWVLERPSAHIGLSAVLPAGMALCFCLYIELTRRLNDQPETTKLFHTALWVFTVLTVVVPLIWTTPSFADFLALVTIGLLGCCGLYGLDVALLTDSPFILLPFLLLQPWFASMLHAARNGVFPSLATWLAGMLLTVGVLIAYPYRRPVVSE